jgi:6-pyruvoyltetrahydropterin/6-carboxytetrahydropterin synthase
VAASTAPAAWPTISGALHSNLFEVTLEHVFPAAHALRNYHGRTEPLHGHNFRVQVTVEGAELDEAGLLVDFILLERLVKKTAGELDHKFLNEIPPFDCVNPSAENLARHFCERLQEELDRALQQRMLRVSRVQVWELNHASATYRP